MSGNGRRLLVIDPSTRRAETEGAAEILGRWSGESRLIRPVLVRDETLPGPGGYDADGIVVMGSAASVHEPADWIAALGDWLAPILDGRVRLPLLGICFGHQLIAHLAGGRVERLDAGRSKRVGVERSNLDDSRLLGAGRSLKVVVSHREQVVRPPPGYRVIARRSGVPVDGLEHASLPIDSFQFHPEARGEFAVHAGIPVDAIDDSVRADGRRLIDAFLERVGGDRTASRARVGRATDP